MAFSRNNSTTKRQALYDRCCGENEFPLCNICGLPVTPGQDWDESHMPVPKALGGKQTGIAHRKHNREHGAAVITPMVAKCKRVRARHTRAWRPKHPMPGGKWDSRKRTMEGMVVDRATGERWGRK